jgi:hypothetical protein
VTQEVVCGNGICDVGETKFNCSIDCGESKQQPPKTGCPPAC